MLYSLGLFVAGLVIVTLGADLLVKGASRLAAALGIPPLIIGLTVVAFGTSAPELAVSIQAAITGQADIALGNVVGSNLFNVLFILGLCALVAPLAVDRQLVRLDVPIMVGSALICFAFALDGRISQFEGLVFVVGLLGYIGLLIRLAKKGKIASVQLDSSELEVNTPHNSKFFAWQGFITLVGLGFLILGARLLVSSATSIALSLGISELIIGLTIVAVGTSLPEVATSVVATIKGQREIAIGNVVGSNIFNILSVLGISAAVSPQGIGVSEQILAFDFPAMVVVSLVCIPIFFSGHSISRGEGSLLLGGYVAYTAYLVLSAQEHSLLPNYTAILQGYVLPMALIALVGMFLVEHRVFKKATAK